MRILVLSDLKEDHSPGEDLLAEDYPEAERIVVADQESLVHALMQEMPDLVLASYYLPWIARPDLMQIIQLHRPGLPVLLVKEPNNAGPPNLSEALSQNYHIIEPLLNTPTDIIGLFDAERRILLANRTFYQDSGKSPEEVNGRTLFDILPRPVAEKRDATLRQVLETGETIRIEDHGVDGWLDSTIFPIFDPHGQITHAMVYAHDITGRINLENALRESHAMVDALLNATSDLIILFDQEGKILTANKSFYQRFNLQNGAANGLCLSDLFSNASAQKGDQILKQVFETGEIFHADGTGPSGNFESIAYPIRNKQNEVLYMAVFVRDITDRVQMEEMLRRDRRTMLAMANIPNDIFVLLDRTGNILMANETMARSVDRSAQEVTGLCLWDLFPEEINERRRAVFERVLKTGLSERVEDKGRIGIYDTQVVPIHDDQGQVAQVVIMARDITNRKLYEETLRRDQRTMLAMANAPNDILVLLDLSGTILMTNEVMARSLSKHVDDLVGQCFWDQLPKPVADFRRGVFDRVVQTGNPERLDDKGRYGIYDSRVIPIHDDEGQVVQVVIMARDITERIQTEQALIASEERYRTLVETSPDGIAYQDLQGNLLFVNHQFATLFGYEGPEEIYNSSINGADLIDEQNLAQRKEKVVSVWQDGSMRDALFTVHRKDGSIFQIEVNGSVVCDPEGKPTGIITICRDVTERKKIEFSLQESEKRYRALIETSPDGIIYYDLDDNLVGRLRILNQQFANLFGYENAEELNSSVGSIKELIAEYDHHRLSETIQSGLKNGYIRDVIFTARRKNGSVFQLEANGSMVYDQNGKPGGYFGIFRDVTDRIHIQKELVRAQETLEQRVLERTAELQALNRQLRKEIYLRKQAEENWKRQALHSEALARVASRANAHLDINAVMKTICEEVIHAIPFSICSVNLYNEQDDCLYIAGYASKVRLNLYSVPPTPRPLFEEYVRQFGGIIILPDVATLPETAYLVSATSPDIRTLIIMPFYHKEALIGSLNLASVGEVRLPTTEEIDLLRAISDQSALSITNARLFERVSDNQARLKILTERLVEIQEEEKRHLARELHDEIGQMLTSLSLNLEIASRLVQVGEAKSSIQFELERVRWQVKRLLDEVRDLSLNLLPAMLDDLGLLPTLLDHCQRFTSQTGILVNLSHRGLEERVPPQVEIAAYRIVQEALTNVARHAAVNQVDVRLWATPQELGIQIEDQGVGFNLHKVESGDKSHGIAGMRERAANCNGNLEVETSPGMGTCLTAEFPLTKPDQIQETL